MTRKRSWSYPCPPSDCVFKLFGHTQSSWDFKQPAFWKERRISAGLPRVTASGPEDLPGDLAALSLTLQLSLPPEVHCGQCVGEISLFFTLCCCAMWDRRLFLLGEVRKQSTAAALPSALERAETCQQRAATGGSHLSLKPCFPQCSMQIWWDRCSLFVIISWVQLPYLKPLRCSWIRPQLYLCFCSGQEQGLGEGGGYRANLQDVGPCALPALCGTGNYRAECYFRRFINPQEMSLILLYQSASNQYKLGAPSALWQVQTYLHHKEHHLFLFVVITKAVNIRSLSLFSKTIHSFIALLYSS